MTSLEKKNRRTGVALALFLAGLFVYSFFVVKHRGKLPEPENLTPVQKLFRGL